MFLLWWTKWRISQSEECIHLSETNEPWFAMLRNEANEVFNAPVICAAGLSIESVMVSPIVDAAGIAARAVEGRSLKGIVQDANSEMDPDIHGIVPRFSV
ncbi:MAG: hypothetical protein K0Q55_2976 [Verrucomicrobia bacterium]|jgi:hypothetical protein|nr:hypothetical protein [Verrucomicrobiota bacterium]